MGRDIPPLPIRLHGMFPDEAHIQLYVFNSLGVLRVPPVSFSFTSLPKQYVGVLISLWLFLFSYKYTIHKCVELRGNM
jgi:hypothetical protein